MYGYDFLYNYSEYELYEENFETEEEALNVLKSMFDRGITELVEIQNNFRNAIKQAPIFSLYGFSLKKEDIGCSFNLYVFKFLFSFFLIVLYKDFAVEETLYIFPISNNLV